MAKITREEFLLKRYVELGHFASDYLKKVGTDARKRAQLLDVLDTTLKTLHAQSKKILDPRLADVDCPTGWKNCNGVCIPFDAPCDEVG